MATKQFKNEKIEYYKKQFENAKVAVVADYRGLSVEEITELRRELQKTDADLTVTKNTLCKVASQGTNFEEISELMSDCNQHERRMMFEIMRTVRDVLIQNRVNQGRE